MAPQLDKYFQQVDSLASTFIERLSEAVAIPSISAEPARRPDVVRMGHWLADQLRGLGADVEARPLGRQPGTDGLELPPVIVARYGADAAKRTILVYGHYDVQPAAQADGWATEPFKLRVDGQGRMFGRGSTDDKGPVLGWLNAIEAHAAAGLAFPVNLLMCFEGMEECGSDGLDAFIQAECRPGGFFADAQAVCISDNYWLGTERPCLTYGLRGCSYFALTVSGPGQDLHSGVFGGSAQEPLVDLVRVLATLVDTDGVIQIPGIREMVAPLTAAEAGLYAPIAYSMRDLHASLGSTTSMQASKEATLMARWRYPSLSIHGVEGAFSGAGAKTVIPATVVGKFSIRTVPDMRTEAVTAAVTRHVDAQFRRLGSKNTCAVTLVHAGNWWLSSPEHWNFTAAAKAVESVFGVRPDLTREGGRCVQNHATLRSEDRRC